MVSDHHLEQLRLEEGELAAPKRRNLCRVVIQAYDRVSELGQARPGDEPHVTGPDDRDSPLTVGVMLRHRPDDAKAVRRPIRRAVMRTVVSAIRYAVEATVGCTVR